MFEGPNDFPFLVSQKAGKYSKGTAVALATCRHKWTYAEHKQRCVARPITHSETDPPESTKSSNKAKSNLVFDNRIPTNLSPSADFIWNVSLFGAICAFVFLARSWEECNYLWQSRKSLSNSCIAILTFARTLLRRNKTPLWFMMDFVLRELTSFGKSDSNCIKHYFMCENIFSMWNCGISIQNHRFSPDCLIPLPVDHLM